MDLNEEKRIKVQLGGRQVGKSFAQHLEDDIKCAEAKHVIGLSNKADDALNPQKRDFFFDNIQGQRMKLKPLVIAVRIANVGI